MSLLLSQTLTAVGPGLTSSFAATGGSSPYTYSVLPNGAGGTISSSTGLYTAPSSVGSSPQALIDTVLVTDHAGLKATSTILVGGPLLLFCDIIQTYLEENIDLPAGRVYLWDQKIMQPTDSGMYVAVSVPTCKPFANNTVHDSSGNSVQSVNVMATIDIDVISRDAEARDRKEFVVLALMSDYAQAQQEANGFLIGRIPPSSRFVNLSQIDGAAIPYRYKISVNMQYAVNNTQATPYFNTFSTVTVDTNQ